MAERAGRLLQAFSRELFRVGVQLRLFHSRVAPVLLRRRRVWDWTRESGYDPPPPRERHAFGSTCRALMDALPRFTSGIQVPDFDADWALAPVRRLNSAQFRFEDERAIRLEEQMRLEAGRIHWTCPPTFLPAFRLPYYRAELDLDESARKLAGWLGLECSSEPASDVVARVRAVERQRLVEAFRRMPLKAWWELLLDLFLLRPDAPPAVFATRHADADLYLDELRVPRLTYQCETSMHVAMAMEHLANNHFMRVIELAALPQVHGGWRGLTPLQIVRVLYRKLVVLRELARRIGYQ